jgi:hypothetical protein
MRLARAIHRRDEFGANYDLEVEASILERTDLNLQHSASDLLMRCAFTSPAYLAILSR